MSARTHDLTGEDLRQCQLADLERLFATPRRVAPPSGRFRGRFLVPVDSAGAHAPKNRLYMWVGFRLLPFGIDFERQTWFFSRVRVGGFSPTLGRSRWRATEVVALHYQVSRLPAFLKKHLYDEIKPLSDSLCLGLGGINADVGAGDHFFFALERVDSTAPKARQLAGRLRRDATRRQSTAPKARQP